jgi:hypothetical protein
MSALIRGSCLALGLFAVAAYAGDRAKPAERYELTPIVATNNAPCEPGFTQNTFTRRMNESGQVIGYHECWEATGDPTRPFLINFGWGYVWTPGNGSRLLPNIAADAQGTFGRAIDELGIAVGWEFTPTSINAPIWFPEGGSAYIVEPLPCSGFLISQAEDINDHQSFAASSVRASTSGTGCARRWILRLANGTEFIGPQAGRPSALNNHDVLVGQQLNDAIKWSPTLGTVVLQAGTPFDRAQAWNLNDREEVVGEFVHNDPNDPCVSIRDAMYWSPTGTGRILERLRNDTHGTALSINEHGLVVGYSETFAGCNGFEPDRRRAVIWHKGRVTDLNKLLKQSDARAIQLITASAISNRGQIAAYGFYRNQPLTKCWNISLDPDTGEESYDDTLQCRSIYAFLLTPDRDD